MKNMLRILCGYFLFLMFVTFPAHANTELSLVQEFTAAVSGPSLYRAWSRNGAVYKAAHPWGVVWKENCFRLQIPCTEEAWKKIRVGQKFYLPAPTILVAVSDERKASEPQMLGGEVSPGLYALTPDVLSATATHLEQMENDLERAQTIQHTLAIERDLEKKFAQVFGVLFALTFIALFYCLLRLGMRPPQPKEPSSKKCVSDVFCPVCGGTRICVTCENQTPKTSLADHAPPWWHST